MRRERLIGFGSRAFAIANSGRVRMVGQLLLLVGLVFVVLRLRSIWRDSALSLGQVRWAYIAIAVGTAACGVVASSFIWLAILRRLGVATQSAWAGIFLQAQVAKYVPGSFWQYAGRTALAQSRGIPLRPTAKSLPIELGASAMAAGIFAILFIGWWGVVGLAVILGALVVVELAIDRNRLVMRATLRATLQYGAVWLLIGTSFWMTAHAFVAVRADDVPQYFAAFATAWLVGLVAIYAPGGIGVREAVLVGLLRGKIGSADALVVATASRGVMTSVDLLGAAFGYVVLRRERPPTDHPGRSAKSIT
jgi:glycosyltransferase 2 family protein